MYICMNVGYVSSKDIIGILVSEPKLGCKLRNGHCSAAPKLCWLQFLLLRTDLNQGLLAYLYKLLVPVLLA